jgi:transcriptional regulator with XRE-family HTH domain
MTNDAKTIFSKRLKEARLDRKLTQEALGVAIGLDESAANTRISRYENGIHAVEPNTAERLAQALDLPLAYFYADTDKMAEVIKNFALLSVEQQQSLLQRLYEWGQDNSQKGENLYEN